MQDRLAVRDWSIDTLKGLLVIAMVLSHTIQLQGLPNNPLLYEIAQIVNLFAFSGFLFAFGYACDLAYFQCERLPYRRILRAAVKPAIAFYISALAFRLLPDHYLSTFRNILSILVFRDIAPFSEFLPTLSLAILLAALLMRPLSVVLSNTRLFVATTVLLLLTTFIPYEVINVRQIGLLVGATDFAAYPVVQYFPAFLIGMLFARRKIGVDQTLMWLAVAGTTMFGIYRAFQGWPSRFPPSLPWILGSLCLVYLIFLAAIWLSRIGRCVSLLAPIGRNALFYLVLSNLVLFSLKAEFPAANLDLISCIVLEVVILLCIQFCTIIVTHAPLAKPGPA